MTQTTQIQTAIRPTRQEDYAEWYQQVVKAADLAENSSVRGCMVIKPWGYALWENIQSILDKMFKSTGHKNAYFPLFIPMSSFEKEAKHVEGFAKECAVVTHSRLEVGPQGKLIPGSPLEEPLVVRPTSELVIGQSFSKWIQSYRDLPILINQWCNVVRWEMRTRLFLRTTEFLWQEGHTAHSHAQEAIEETQIILNLYKTLLKDYLAIPITCGRKTDSERFPGADETFCIEAMMQDRKAIQICTSHYLGQNFSKACDIQFVNTSGKQEYAYTTSWGMTTRTIGGLIMTHADDNGMIIPPRIAPTHIVIIPIIHKEEDKESVIKYCQSLESELKQVQWDHKSLNIHMDNRELRSSEKSWEYIKKGVPIIIEIGPKDIAKQGIYVTFRDKGPKAKVSLERSVFVNSIIQELESMQARLYEKALTYTLAHTQKIDNKEDFYAFFTPQNKEKPEIHAGFALAHWNRDPKIEEQLKQELKVTIRCIPMEGESEPGVCFMSGEPSPGRVVFAKSY